MSRLLRSPRRFRLLLAEAFGYLRLRVATVWAGSRRRRRDLFTEVLTYVALVSIIGGYWQLKVQGRQGSANSHELAVQQVARVSDLRASCRHTSRTDAQQVNTWWVDYITERALTPPLPTDSGYGRRAAAAFKLREANDKASALAYATHVDPHDLARVKYKIPRQAAQKDGFSCVKAYPEHAA